MILSLKHTQGYIYNDFKGTMLTPERKSMAQIGQKLKVMDECNPDFELTTKLNGAWYSLNLN